MDRSIVRGLAVGVVALLGLAGCKFGDNSNSTYDGGFDGFAPQVPLLVATPSTADFGMVSVGSKSATKTITVANVGPGTTGTLAIQLSGGNAFVVDTDGCTGMSLATIGNCSVGVHFAPTAAGMQSATLDVSGNPGGSVTVSLSGTGAETGSLAIAPSTNDFGSLIVGSPSAPVTFTVTNKGSAATGAVAVALSGSDADQFAVSADLCSGKTLAPLATCTVAVSASPITPGSKTATLTAQAAGDSGTATASLAANALAGPAHLTVTPTSQPLGSVLQGETGSDFPFTVTNTGDQTIGPISAAISGMMMSDFGLGMNGCAGQMLTKGGTCTVYAHFAPGLSSRGAESATLTVSASPGGSVPVALTGTAQAPAQLALVQLPVPEWTGIGVGTVSAPMMVTVQNLGDLPTDTISYSFTGGNAGDFLTNESNPCTGSLAAGQGCMFQMQFEPSTAVGTESTTLQATSTTGGTAQMIVEGTALWVLTLNMVNDPTMGTDGGPSCYSQYLTAATITSCVDVDGGVCPAGPTCSIVNGASTMCTWLYADGTTITLTQGSTTYAQLTLEGCVSTSTPQSCSFTMTSSVNITADYCGHAS
jgi:hypothetical protein